LQAFFDTTISTLRKLMEEVDLARAAARSDGCGLDDEEMDETELKVFEAISRLGTWPAQKMHPDRSPPHP
jgi:hypothetical protein